MNHSQKRPRRVVGALLAAFAVAQSLTACAGGFALSGPTLSATLPLPAEHVFNGFGCTGGNVSPALAWKDAPAGTQSFAVTAYDPDAPTGSGWWHWVVVNIPATVTRLDAGAGDVSGKNLPPGASQIRTDFGQPGFGGACPPKGDKPHRYIFTVHALKVPRIDLPPEASAAMAGFMINANRIGQTHLTVLYGR